jgi:hypothetical protein
MMLSCVLGHVFANTTAAFEKIKRGCLYFYYLLGNIQGNPLWPCTIFTWYQDHYVANRYAINSVRRSLSQFTIELGCLILANRVAISLNLYMSGWMYRFHNTSQWPRIRL